MPKGVIDKPLISILSLFFLCQVCVAGGLTRGETYVDHVRRSYRIDRLLTSNDASGVEVYSATEIDTGKQWVIRVVNDEILLPAHRVGHAARVAVGEGGVALLEAIPIKDRTRHLVIPESISLRRNAETPALMAQRMERFDGSLEALVTDLKLSVDLTPAEFSRRVGLLQSIAQQMLRATEELERRKLIHLDIKPENFLYRRLADGNVEVALSDFEFVIERENRYRKGVSPRDIVGTDGYIAPEVGKHGLSAASHAVDSFATGRTMGKLLTGSLYHSRNSERMESLYAYFEALPVPPKEEEGHRRALGQLRSQIDFILANLTPDPGERPSLDSAVTKRVFAPPPIVRRSFLASCVAVLWRAIFPTPP